MGALQREGQTAVSKACGAAVGSYKAIQAKEEKARKEGLLPTSAVRDIPDYDNDPFDPELGIIIDLLTPRLAGLEKSAEPITFVTYQMYTIVRTLPCAMPLERAWLERTDSHTLQGAPQAWYRRGLAASG